LKNFIKYGTISIHGSKNRFELRENTLYMFGGVFYIHKTKYKKMTGKRIWFGMLGMVLALH